VPVALAKLRSITHANDKIPPGFLIPACRRVDPKFRDPIHSVRMGTYEMPGRSSRVKDDHALLLLLNLGSINGDCAYVDLVLPLVCCVLD
jgi:hypothetical protein